MLTHARDAEVEVHESRDEGRPDVRRQRRDAEVAVLGRIRRCRSRFADRRAERRGAAKVSLLLP
jgi:hypothetical protein